MVIGTAEIEAEQIASWVKNSLRKMSQLCGLRKFKLWVW